MDRSGDLTSASELLSFPAVQAQRHSPPPYSAGALPRHELAGVWGRPAATRRPDAVGGRSGADRLGGTEAEQPRRAAALLRAGHRTRADLAARVPPGPAPGRGVQPQRAAPARAGARGAGPLDAQPPRPGVRGPATACPGQCWADTPGAGQHGAGAVRPRRVGRRKARPSAPAVAQAAPGRERRHGRDRRPRADRGATPTTRPRCRPYSDRQRA